MHVSLITLKWHTVPRGQHTSLLPIKMYPFRVVWNVPVMGSNGIFFGLWHKQSWPSQNRIDIIGRKTQLCVSGGKQVPMRVTSLHPESVCVCVCMCVCARARALSPSVVSDSLWPQGLQPPGSSVHWIFQVRILEWVAIASSKGSSWPKNWIWIFCVSCTAGGFFTRWATQEAPSALQTD